jgi:hypothetical protein
MSPKASAPVEAKTREAQVSPQYRIIFANSFELVITDNEFSLGLCVGGETLGQPGSRYREATVMLTPRSAKVLATLLQGSIERFEQESGPIMLAEGKLENIQQSIREAKSTAA